MTITSGAIVESDYFAIDVLEGDVVEVAVGQNATKIEVYDDQQSLVMSSKINIAFLIPDDSKLGDLPGNASVIFVASKSGVYFLKARIGLFNGGCKLSPASYNTKTSLRAGVSTKKADSFCGFDGAIINGSDLFEFGNSDAELSSLTMFLENWGLNYEDEDEVIDSILSVMEEQLKSHIQQSVSNEKIDLEILNSRDHADILA